MKYFDFGDFRKIFLQVVDEYKYLTEVWKDGKQVKERKPPTESDIRYFFYQVPSEPVGAAMRYLKLTVVR